MDSFEVLYTESNAGSFTSRDCSILPEILMHSVKNGAVTHITDNLNFLNMQSALSAVSPDVSLEEVETRLMELTHTNLSLKEALNKNNLLLKNQMNALPAWQENKQCLEKAKENISLLEKENADLHRRLSNLEMECLTLKNKESCKNCESLTVDLQKLLNDKKAAEESKDLLSEEINKTKNFHKHLHEIMMMIHDQLHYLYCTGKHTDRQKEELNNVLKCLNKASDELMLQSSTEIENLKQKLEGKHKTLQTSKELMLQTSTEIENLIKVLEEQNKKLQTSEELILQMCTETENLRKELKEKNEKLQIFEKLTVQTSARIENLMKELEEKNKKLQASDELRLQTSTDIENLKKELEKKSEKLNLSSKQEKHRSKIVESYVKSIEDLDTPLKSQHKVVQNELANKSTLARKYKERCEILQQQIDKYQIELKNSKTSSDQSIMQLREELKSSKLEQCANQEDKAKLSVVMMQHEKLQADYYRVTQQLEKQSKDENMITEQLTVLRSNDANHIDYLTARVLDLELRLEEKEEDMKKLIEELVTKDEAVLILQAEIGLKADVEHAVSASDSPLSDIEDLEEELKRHREENSDASGYYSTKKKK